jgi:outer membrane protein
MKGRMMRWLVAIAALICPSLACPTFARADEALTLERAIELARNRNPLVEAQRAQVVSADGRVPQSAAGRFPVLTGGCAFQPQTANYSPTPANRAVNTRGIRTVADTNGQPAVVTCPTVGVGGCLPTPALSTSYALVNFWTASVGVVWTPWDWGRSIYGYKSARSAAASSSVGIVTAQRNVVLNLKLAFFGVLTADEQVKVGLESVATFGQQLDQIRAFYASGLRTKIDVVTAESALASAEVLLARARAAVETSRAQLSFALGEDSWHGWRLVPVPGIFDRLPGDEARARTADSSLSQIAFHQRSELRQLDLLGLSFRQLERSQRGQYLPQLNFAAGPSWTGEQLSSLVPNLTITVALEYPLGGMSPLLVRGQIRESRGNLLATLAQERATREAIRQETVDARALLAAGLEELAAAQTLVAAATAQRELAIGRYAAGVGTIIELTNALLNYVSARFQLVQAGYDLASARAQLQHALGEDG